MTQAKIRTVDVDASNVAEEGFFCYKSKPKTEGYHRKLEWLKQRFAEGMKIKILYENNRSVGFIEYIPSEFAWRAVKAQDYMLIHCLWVVGSGKKKGYGSHLLNECLEDARNNRKQGVAMVTSSKVWLADKKIFLKNGFESVDQAPPFELLVKKFNDGPTPAFPTDWTERQARFGPGLTILRSDQCPYIESAVEIIVDTAAELGVPAKVVELNNSQEIQATAPAPYGLFSIIYNGQLLSYHYLTKKELVKRLQGQSN